MKTLILLAFTAGSFLSTSAQFSTDCDRNLSLMYNFSVGYNNKTSPVINSELGVFHINSGIGIVAGINLYSETKGYKDAISNNTPTTDGYLKFIYRTFSSDKSKQYITSWFSYKGDLGISYRFMKYLSPYTMIGIEPNASTKKSVGLNIVLSASLN